MSSENQKYMCIDIGSNAMRASVAELDMSNDLEILKSYRYPLRLGEEIFKTGKLTQNKIDNTLKAFIHLKELINKHNVQNISAIATSAMRTCENSDELIKLIATKTGILIKIIDGTEEAKLIRKAVCSTFSLDNENVILMDIGGGSTEFSLLLKNNVVFTKSYPIGTLRLLEMGPSKKEDSLIKLVDELASDIQPFLKENQIQQMIGTGGNLKRMGKLRKLFFEKSQRKISLLELREINFEIKKLTLHQRQVYLSMKEDRADVIVPAMDIVEATLSKLNISEILLPTVGLKEGVLLDQIQGKPRNFLLN